MIIYKICPICKLNVPYLVECRLCDNKNECVCLYCKNDDLTHNYKLNLETKMVDLVNKILNCKSLIEKELYRQEFYNLKSIYNKLK